MREEEEGGQRHDRKRVDRGLITSMVVWPAGRHPCRSEPRPWSLPTSFGATTPSYCQIELPIMKDTLAWAGAWKPDPGPVLGPLHGPPAPSMTASARRCEFATRSRDSSMVARRREGKEGEA